MPRRLRHFLQHEQRLRDGYGFRLKSYRCVLEVFDDTHVGRDQSRPLLRIDRDRLFNAGDEIGRAGGCGGVFDATADGSSW